MERREACDQEIAGHESSSERKSFEGGVWCTTPGCRERLPIAEIGVAGSFVVTCPACGKGTRISIEQGCGNSPLAPRPSANDETEDSDGTEVMQGNGGVAVIRNAGPVVVNVGHEARPVAGGEVRLEQAERGVGETQELEGRIAVLADVLTKVLQWVSTASAHARTGGPRGPEGISP